MTYRHILILDGSPKNTHSTTTVLSNFLGEKLSGKGMDISRKKIRSALASEGNMDGLMAQARASDLIFLIFPLYVDGPPYNVIRAMELMKTHLIDREANSRKTFMALCQSGMEVHKNRIALRICECFAKDLGFKSGGTFALGFGGVLNGAALTSLNRLTRNVQQALDLMADSIAKGRDIPAETQRLLEKPLMPGPMPVKRFLFNSAMKSCLDKQSFNKGIDQLHSRLRLFFY